MKKGCVGELGQGECLGLRFELAILVPRYCPHFAGGFSLGEPWSQDGFISLPGCQVLYCLLSLPDL